MEVPTRWLDKANGEMRVSLDVTCQELQFLGGGQGQSHEVAEETADVSAGLSPPFSVIVMVSHRETDVSPSKR